MLLTGIKNKHPAWQHRDNNSNSQLFTLVRIHRGVNKLRVQFSEWPQGGSSDKGCKNCVCVSVRMTYLLKVGVVRGVWGVWNCTGLTTGLKSWPPTCGSVSEKSETALCAATKTHNDTYESLSLWLHNTITPQSRRTWQQVRIKCWVSVSVLVFVVAEDTGEELQKRNGGWEAEQLIVYEA